MEVDLVVFNGIRFRRYPNSSNEPHRRYYTPAANYRRQGIESLHREIWKAAHGPIPDGHHIHHRDHNPLNNDLSNLECLSEFEHLSRHGRQNPPTLSMFARQRAAEWHRSEAGREWHSEHGRQSWASRVVVRRICEQCGKSYETRSLSGKERFCSNNCKSAFRRASGVDLVERACECCGTVWRLNRYSAQRFCSRSCGQRHRFGKCGCILAS